jgi:hypothetical protein
MWMVWLNTSNERAVREASDPISHVSKRALHFSNSSQFESWQRLTRFDQAWCKRSYSEITNSIFKRKHHNHLTQPTNIDPNTTTMPPKQPKQPKFDSLTTAGRIAKAAHIREQATAKFTPTSLPPDSAPPKKKRRKTVFAPPAELEAEAARRAEAKKMQKPQPKQAPLTTKYKVAAGKTKTKKAFGLVEDDVEGIRGGSAGEAKRKERSRAI